MSVGLAWVRVVVRALCDYGCRATGGEGAAQHKVKLPESAGTIG